MPVPVPYCSKPNSHPVIKPHRQLPAHTFVQPIITGQPQQECHSFARGKQPVSEQDFFALSNQGFHKGLTAADNAPVIKGLHAEACLPPMYNLMDVSHFAGGASGVDLNRANLAHRHEGVLDYPSINKPAPDGYLQWPPQPQAVVAAHNSARHVTSDASIAFSAATPPFDSHMPVIDKGAYIPEPSTPFAQFVDRAISNAQSFPINRSDYDRPAVDYAHATDNATYPVPPVYPTIAEQPQRSSDTITPSATSGYKKLSEPLSDWVANYVWKVCSTGFGLHAAFAQPGHPGTQLPAAPPSWLASSIHSVLLSTLLQPSGVLLALWYISHLPVFLGAAPLPMEAIKEQAFRAVLFTDGMQNNDSIEANGPFRVIMLGFMLANKWLDDHTFSNKTWHSISNIPVQTLNKLEIAALDLFQWDLSISNQEWTQWLGHLMSYHHSLVASGLPQPIGRPSSNPHTIVRKGIEELIEGSPIRYAAENLPTPTFLGLEERLREIIIEQETAMEISDIDLDEDGPLREEYMPKRRASTRAAHEHVTTLANNQNWDIGKVASAKQLPPPAKWSPAGDEPILRNKNRSSINYVAVQPTVLGAPIRHQEAAYNQNWNPSPVSFFPPKSQTAFAFEGPRPAQAIFAPFGQAPQVAHTRSQSLCQDQENVMLRNHLRSYSQVGLEHIYNDIRTAMNELAARDSEARWMDPAARYPYHGPAYFSIPAIGMQSAW